MALWDPEQPEDEGTALPSIDPRLLPIGSFSPFRPQPPEQQPLWKRGLNAGLGALGALNEYVVEKPYQWGVEKLYGPQGIEQTIRERMGLPRTSGLAVPEQGPESTAAGAAVESLYPANPERGGIIDYARMVNPTIAAGLPERGALRGVASGAMEMGTQMALDPLTYVALGLSRGAQGARLSQKLLATQPGIRQYAPEIARALEEAAVRPGPGAVSRGIAELTGVSPERVAQAANVARRTAEKAAHVGFPAMMLTGGAQQLGQAAAQSLEAGEVTPEAAAEATKGVLSLAMAGLPLVGRMQARALEAEAGKAGGILPTRVIPTDRLPDTIRPQAEQAASWLAQKIARDPSLDEGALKDLPEELQRYGKTIWEQAREEGGEIRDGRTFLERLQQEQGQGPEGVRVEQGPEGSQRVVQRDAEGNVIGGAQVNSGALTMIAGGRGMGAPESIRPVYQALRDMGAKFGVDLSVAGAKARRTAAERFAPRDILEGRARMPTPEETRQAGETLRREGLLEDVLAGPKYATEDYVSAQRPKLQSLKQEADTMIADLESKKSERYGSMDNKTLLEVGDRLRQQINLARESGDAARVAAAQERLTDQQAEKSRREALAGWQRQARAAGKSLETGSLFVGSEDIPKLLRQQRDVYRDHGLKPNERGQYPDRPDLFLTSDLSGRQIRHYVKLPDGRIAHPDELTEWKRRGRIVSDARYATEAGPGLYSQLRRVVESPKTQAAQKGGDWLRFLQDPKRQVKADELKWTGLDEYLKGRSGERVSREDIQRFLDQNEVRVEEVTRGTARPPQIDWTPDAETPDVLWGKFPDANSPAWQIAKVPRTGEYEAALTFGGTERSRRFPTIEEAQKWASDTSQSMGLAEDVTPTKFQTYTLPGGENYREVLLTLPGKKNALPPGYKIEQVSEGQWVMRNPEGKVEMTGPSRADLEKSVDWSFRTAGKAKPGEFVGGHFDEPNVLAHVRLDDRTGPNGEKVLFVEEIQSDWAQKGRREGFGPGEIIVRKMKPEDFAPEEYWPKGKEAWGAFAPDGRRLYVGQSEEAARVAGQERAGHGPPAAPFVGKTEDWTNLALKRILRMAAEQGYDKVAWTTGEQQAARYDLSKQVSRVTLRPNARGEGGYLVAYDLDGRPVIERGVTNAELPDLIGKDAADKLLSAPEQTLEIPGPGISKNTARVKEISGLDLKVGGEGMRGFYDEIVPAAAKKLGKKWGARVETTKLETGGRPSNATRNAALMDLDRGLRKAGASIEDVSAWTATWARGGREAAAEIAPDVVRDYEARMSPEKSAVHSIDITPAMRESVAKEGFPLFAAEQGAAPEPARIRDLLVDLYPEKSKITEAEGEWKVTLPDKREVTWRVKPEGIEFDLEAFRKGYGREPKPGERPIAATYTLPNSALVELAQGVSDRGVVHEHWHVLKHLGNLSEKQLKTLSKKYANEEAEADAFYDWFSKEKRPANSVFESIWRAIQSVYRTVVGAPEKVFEQALQSGLSGEPGPPRLRTPEGLIPAVPSAEPPPSPAAVPPAVAVGGGAEIPPSVPPPAPAPRFATAAEVPEPTPLGEGRATGNPPRVEQRVTTLEDAIKQQHELGIPSDDLVLSRAHARTWDSLDPQVRDKLETWDDDKMLRELGWRKQEDGSWTDTGRGRRLSDYEVQALDAVVRARREAKDLALEEYNAKRGTEGETDAWRKYVQSIAKFLPLERANVNDGTGTARALAARARLMKAAENKDMKFLRQVMRELPGVDERGAVELQRMFETGDPRLADALRAATAGRWKQWQTFLRAILITPSSEVANLTGNIMVQGVELADRAVSANVDWVLSKLRKAPRERYLGEVQAELGGMAEAVMPALNTFLKERFAGIYKRAWSGEAKIEPGRRFEYQVAPFQSKGMRLIATSLDALQAGDDLFQAPIAQGILARQAYRRAVKAVGETYGPRVMGEAQRIIADYVDRPEKYPELTNEIRSETNRRLFKDRPWKMVDFLQEWEKRWPWMTAVLPFIKTPANIAKYAIRHSPLGFGSPEVWRAIGDFKKGKISQGQLADTLAPRIVGTQIFGAFVAAAASGKLTGSGPTDYRQRRALEETGWRPYSVVVELGGTKYYIPFERFDPVSQMAGVAADVVEFKDMQDAHDIASKAIGSIAQNFTDRTYLKGLTDFSDALSDPLRFAGQYAINIGRMHVPRQLARIAMALDPVVRDPRPLDKGPMGWGKRFVNVVVRDIPGLSKSLPASVSATGEPVTRPGEGVPGALMRAFSPVQVSPERPGRELERTMAETGYVPSPPRDYMTIQGKRVGLDRRDMEILQRGDRAAAYELRRLAARPSFQRLPDTVEEGGNNSKEAIIRATYQRHRDAARQFLLQQRDFRRRAMEQLRAQP